jgi:phosphomannomutase
MQCPKAAIFDLDDTLAESFQPPTEEMIERLIRLLDLVPISILSAAGFPRIEAQFLDALAVSPHIDRCYIFPNSASQCYIREESGWRQAYSLDLTPEERGAITAAIQESVTETGIIELHPKYEPQIIDREAQIAYAAIGLKATEEDKVAWDPDQSKRRHLKTAIESRLQGFEVLMGGKTTIDITRSGVDKAYGVRWLAKHLGFKPEDMLFVGDALYEGGNDAVVIPTGIQTRSVTGPDETAKIIDELLLICAS